MILLISGQLHLKAHPFSVTYHVYATCPSLHSRHAFVITTSTSYSHYHTHTPNSHSSRLPLLSVHLPLTSQHRLQLEMVGTFYSIKTMNMGTNQTLHKYAFYWWLYDYDNSIIMPHNAIVSFDTFIRVRDASEENRTYLQWQFEALFVLYSSNNCNLVW